MSTATVSLDEFDTADRVLTTIGDGDDSVEVGVFRIDDQFRAYRNECPHQGGPVCEGQLTGSMELVVDPDTGEHSQEWARDGEILACPWCSWEFDLLTGDSLSRDGVSLSPVDLSLRDDHLRLSLD